MAHPQSQSDLFRNLKCADCCSNLQDPVQLPACLHILCQSCEKILESKSSHNICCPKCKQENAKPGVLQQISGVEPSSHQNMQCDSSPDHDLAKWNCFECGKNLCASCRGSHDKEHKINLLATHDTLKNKIWKQKHHEHEDSQTASLPRLPTLMEDQIEGSLYRSVLCPLCPESSCQHIKLLQYLIDGSPDAVTYCSQQGHEKKERNYFCLECWIPICGDCSQKGKHKSHPCDDLSDYGIKFIVNSLSTWREKLHIMVESYRQDVVAAKNAEERFDCHVVDIDRELNSRKHKMLEEIEHAFEQALKSAKQQGRSILKDYTDEFDIFNKYFNFLQRVEEAFTNFAVDEQHPTVPQCITAFYHEKIIGEIIAQIHQRYSKNKSAAERQFVLPQIKSELMISPLLKRVGTEWKQLELAFSFELDQDTLFPNSIVLINNTTCLLSYKKFKGQTRDASFTRYQYNESQGQAERVLTNDAKNGDYFLSQLRSGEIVASYSSPCEKPEDKYNRYNEISYLKELPEDSSPLTFVTIKSFEFCCRSIATTKENNILVIVSADEIKEQKGFSYLMLINLLGKELRSTMQEGTNMISPDYVAVSDSGEICVSDKDGSSIVILDDKFQIIERMNYRLPTVLTEELSSRMFEPHGICYDSYGRIIVADPRNNSISRVVRAPGSEKYKLEPLLTEVCGITGFRDPKLVAMGSDSRLWVVCSNHIFVFKYCI